MKIQKLVGTVILLAGVALLIVGLTLQVPGTYLTTYASLDGAAIDGFVDPGVCGRRRVQLHYRRFTGRCENFRAYHGKGGIHCSWGAGDLPWADLSVLRSQGTAHKEAGENRLCA